MPRSQKDFLTQLSAAEMKKLLAARERIDILEEEKAKLTAALAKVDRELEGLMTGVGNAPARPRRKATRKKTAKKATRKVAKKAVKKTAAKKKAVTKTATAKTTKKKVAAGGRVKLEDVVVSVLQKNGGTMSFKELYAAIAKGKLFKTKSKNFDNVLRRTLSTTDKVKRAGRGIYTLG